MKRILHILREKEDRYPIGIIQKQAESNEVTVILTQEAEGLEIPGTKASVFVLPGAAGGIKTAYPQIGYKEMLDAIFSAETVVTW